MKDFQFPELALLFCVVSGPGFLMLFLPGMASADFLLAFHNVPYSVPPSLTRGGPDTMSPHWNHHPSSRVLITVLLLLLFLPVCLPPPTGVSLRTRAECHDS